MVRPDEFTSHVLDPLGPIGPVQPAGFFGVIRSASSNQPFQENGPGWGDVTLLLELVRGQVVQAAVGRTVL